MTIAHGVNGWSLADLEWDHKTGICTMRYERQILGMRESETVQRPQPSRPGHVGWTNREERQPTLYMHTSN